jgi:type IV secretion system protein VirB2
MNFASRRASPRTPSSSGQGPRLTRSLALSSLAGAAAAAPTLAVAQGFTKVATTVGNVSAILVTISVAVVTIAIIWAGFKMIFAGARLADVANVLIGGTLVGGAAAFAAFIVN